MRKYFYSVLLLIIPFISCDKNEEEDNYKDTDVNSIVLYVNKTKDLGVKGDFLTSDNDFVASVSEDGVVTGKHIGETYINTKTKKIPTVVMGMYHLYDDPVLEWGRSMSTVKAKQKQGKISNAATASNVLRYDNAGSATAIGYTFENGKLKSVGVILELKYSSMIADFLLERYFMIPYVTGDIISMGMDSYDPDKATVTVGLAIYNSYIVVLYTNPSD